MASWQKILTLSFTALTLLNGSIAHLSKPVSAGEPLFDRNCRHYPRKTENFVSPPVNEATYSFRTLNFTADRQQYSLTVLRDRDGFATFCISNSNFQQMKRLTNIERIQSKYIYQIVKEQKKNSEFLITLREGNGRRTRTMIYKLDLKTPNRPVLSVANRR